MTKKHNFKYKKHPDHKKIGIKRIIAWALFLAFLSFDVFLVDFNTTHLHASIIPSQVAPAYDGLVAPVDKVPDWVSLNSSQWDQSYNQFSSGQLITMPEYNPNKIKISTDNLTWGNAADDAIRNMKITYGVPYMGNYKLDGREYAGSHLAIDIKMPIGTPIKAIGNGIVHKTSNQTSGFGRHVVIEHQDFPSIDNPNMKVTYYSSYTHLDSVSVTEGSVVKKGQLIGYSGNTGTSSNPHLHFQIDNTNAPWHPYWPFTSKEASDAGLSFTGAVNEGLNQDIAIRNTINPMLYVQKYSDGSSVNISSSSSDSSSTTSSSSTSTNTDTRRTTKTTGTSSSGTTTTTITTSNNSATPEDTVTREPVDPDSIVDDNEKVIANDPERALDSFEIMGSDVFFTGEELVLKIAAINRYGDTIKNFKAERAIKVEVEEGKATVTPSKLTEFDFIDGVATIRLNPLQPSSIKLMVKGENVMKGKTLSPGIFIDISAQHPHYQAISFLKKEGVIQGYPDGSFKPESSVSRVEAIKFILEGIGEQAKSSKNLPFNDAKSTEWYGKYISKALDLKIVEGYPDGSFKPGLTVNKVEFLKMLIEAMEIDVDPNGYDQNFTDIAGNEWFAPYVQFAVEKNLIDTDGKKFMPNERISREIVAEAMYRIKLLSVSGAKKFTADLIDTVDLSAI